MQGENQTFSSLTDSNGRFAFYGVEPGQYSMVAGGNGYAPQGLGRKGSRSGGNTLILTAGSHEKELVFRLAPPAVITGTIHDEDGDPVIGGQVQALRIVHTGSRQQTNPAGFAQTNDLGQYRLYGLESGQYLIVASYQRQQAENTPSSVVYLPTFYPSTSDSGQATPIKVLPADEISGIDVNLDSAPGVMIRGRLVTEVPVKALQGLYVSMMPRNSLRGGYQSASYGGVIRDDGGNFEIHGVPPGSYVLFGNLNDDGHFYSGRALVDVGKADLDGLTVVVGSGVTLRGHVQLSPGAKLDFTHLGVSLQDAEEYMGGAGAQVAADGTFTLNNVADGTYRVNVGGFPEEFYLQSAKLGGTDVLGPGLTVAHYDPSGTLDIVLSRDGGRVDGVVRNDQQPAIGATVVLVPDPPNRNHNELYSFKNTDALGMFSMLGLPPGDFKLFAWEPREGVSFTDPDLLKDYEERGTRVHIEDKTQQSVQLSVIPAD